MHYIHRLDPALIRPGRLTNLLYVGLPDFEVGEKGYGSTVDHDRIIDFDFGLGASRDSTTKLAIDRYRSEHRHQRARGYH